VAWSDNQVSQSNHNFLSQKVVFFALCKVLHVLSLLLEEDVQKEQVVQVQEEQNTLTAGNHID
jgi:hypothetical protein